MTPAMIITLAVLVGCAAVVTVLVAGFRLWAHTLRGNMRAARRWGVLAAVGVVFAGGAVLLSVKYVFGGPSDADMARLVADIRAAYPAEIVAIDFENALPLDPPTVFIDVSPSMGPEAELRFLCDQVKPRVDAVDARIDATTSYGYYASDDCQ